MARTPATFALATLLALCGCDAGDPPRADAGEGGVPPGLPTCSYPLVLVGVEDGTVSAELDTRGGREGGLDLEGCGDPVTSPPRAVVAYEVPGTGPHAVEISTVNVGTDRMFDTVLAVRRGQCDAVLEGTTQGCYDDVGTDRRSTGTLLAEGGEILYVIVTGYDSEGTVDRGPVQVDFTARLNRQPTIESASVLVTPDGVRVEVRAGDEDADAAGVRVTFHGPALELLDVDGDGIADEYDVLTGTFDQSVAGALVFTETATIAGDAPATAREAWVRVVDEAGSVSAMDLAVAVQSGSVVGSGDACSATSVCARELECRAMICEASAERAASCAAASPLAIDPPGTTATSATAEGVLMPGLGIFGGECGSTVGREALYSVTVPDGTYDVIATTDLPGTSTDVDTVLYVRRTCVDPASSPEDGCHDDIDLDTNRRSELVLLDEGPGTLTFFVEHFAGVPADRMARYALEVTLRPVLAMGQSCDPTGVMNRCAAGDCPADARTCP
jgi:hypothetical protein